MCYKETALYLYLCAPGYFFFANSADVDMFHFTTFHLDLLFVNISVELFTDALRQAMVKSNLSCKMTLITRFVATCTLLFQDKLVEKMKSTLGEFYPDGPAKSPDFPRIVNDRHFQ